MYTLGSTAVVYILTRSLPLIDTTPNPTPPSNPISDNATVQMPPVSIPPAQGKLQLWLVAWFGASYETTIPGYIAGFGGILIATGTVIGPTTSIGGKLLAVGGAFVAIGTQQGLQRAKSTKVTGVEPK